MIVVTLPMEMYSTVKKICDETATDIGDFLRHSIEKHVGEAKKDGTTAK
jgi:hypothetical protein